MKTLLYTGHDSTYAKLAAITVPRIAEYADRNGMDFTCHTEPLIKVPHGIYWTGVCGALKAFDEGYDRAIYLDVDQLVTNMDYRLIDWRVGFHASLDWGTDATHPYNFSACGFVCCREAIEMFKEVLSLELEWRDKPFPEQGPLQYVIGKIIGSGHESDRHVHIHPRNFFNNVPDQVCPGKVPEPWKPGYWCAHLTMVDLNRRIEIANEILSSL